MFTHFFINRPIFSCVISLVILLAGVVTYFKLPIAQFPEIVPPVVTVTANYPGANAQTLIETVATPIEQQVNGVDNMIYMTSTCSSNGTYSLSVYFEVGTDPDMSTVLVQNRVSLATPALPNDVTRLGVVVKKRSPNLLGIYCLTSKDDSKDELYLSNYASIFIKDRLARVKGVGEASLLDAKDYSMRVWLDPMIMAERQLSVQEIVKIIQEQNVQVASGSLGAEPVPQGQSNTLTITTQGRLAHPEEFEELIIKKDNQGRVLKLKDIAKIELGNYSYGRASTFNARSSSTIGIYLSPGANAIAVMQGIEKEIEALQETLDNVGLEIHLGYDSTLFIEASIEEVNETLIIALILVIGIVYIFLQDWRAALIPTLTIPVSLVGCFFLMMLLGFSLNTLTMFGLVLVIGIVVDDAIVVVENTQRILNEERNISPIEAAKKSMLQVTGPIIGTTCVLTAVFVPTTFISGMVGQLYTQFALTITGAVFISSICALTIAPALCAIFLRPENEEKKNWFFRLFNWGFNGFAHFYERNLNLCVHRPIMLFGFWCLLVAALYFGMKMMPTGFIPNEDQGVLFLDVRLPDGATLERTLVVRDKVQKILDETSGLEAIIAIAGYSMLDGSAAENLMLGVVRLKPWHDRTKEESAFVLQGKLMARINMEIPEAFTFVFLPPPIMGLGTSGGIECQLLDTRGQGDVPLFEAGNILMQKSMETGKFYNLTNTFRPTVPQLYIDIDREKAKRMGIELSELFATLQTYMGSFYVNDFNQFERVFRVVAQAQGASRQNIEQVLNLPLMNREGKKVPLNSIATVHDIVAPQYLNRFNMSASTMISATLNPGQSTGAGMAEMEKIHLPDGFQLGWSGMSFQERSVGTTVLLVFVLAMIFGFLSLAALYESWSAPLIIMMAVPLGVSGAILAIALRGLEINIYTQIGLILMVGLSAKNAILITEYARDNRIKDGMGIIESAMKAGTLRLRPIMMTSFAFILGVVPLAIASGAGANSRQAIGTAVCGGMLEETMIGIIVTPVLFVLLTRIAESSMKVFRKFLVGKAN